MPRRTAGYSGVRRAQALPAGVQVRSTLDFWLSMIFSENRYTLFRIML
jgi:hypothetical protein